MYIYIMLDSYGRKIDYLRISVTDRCNFRCEYCMPETIKFMPKNNVMDYTEIALLADRFIYHGIKKIRLTGGEPLVRKDIATLIKHLGKYVKSGKLDELTLTTNGSTLSHHSDMLRDNGIKRINVSLDTLDSGKFSAITRRGDLTAVLDGIQIAKQAGLKIKINMVALKNRNENDLLDMAHYCAENGFDLCCIETMPLGNDIKDREENFISLKDFIAPLSNSYSLHKTDYKTAGPATYFDVEALQLKLGLITPLSQNFCNDCNRLRLTTDGKLFMCLGSNLNIDFKQAIRDGGTEKVDGLLQKALRLKPERHFFEDQMTNQNVSIDRHMNVTGG